MKTDWDDAPDYLRSKRQSPWRTVITLGVGAAITWGLIALFAQPIVIDVNQLKQAIRVGGQPLFSEQPTQAYSEPAAPIRLPSLSLEPVQQVAQPPISKAEIEWFERMETIATQRAQNRFNDNNYRPKQPENTYSPPSYQQAETRQREQPQPRRVQRERTSKWIKSWNGGSNYLAEWVAVNNYIDSSSVCANHRKGSIDYRECRKAAKQHYHEECRTWRARYDNDRKDHSDRMKQRYCSAASSFSPMG
ncbi:hypothetical protein FBY03_106117 [Pseudomonas sp. SJZ079]|uniref:hypothetical protein n=1 Tax=Pseudomonas sp. SJZ079 TaxID=2572887 RepID=UPI00119B2C78|nr:hypothetical protein [Pseudomonas sp. SJZ079]TWC38620.1 hypothetical protein FBY03_106117 [Pseudomonas sp. SJZ079]